MYQNLRGRAFKRHFACGSMVLPIYLFVVLFRSQSKKNDKQKEEKYRCERTYLGTA